MPKLLAVLEPTAFHDGVDQAKRDVNWMKAKLESDWVCKALACDGRRGFIHAFADDGELTNGRLVLIHESLLILKQLEKKFQVTYKPWQIHRKAMLEQYGWCSYVGCWDCFYGGPDLGLDLGKDCYQLNSTNEGIYRLSMKRLAEALPVWPPVPEQTDAVRKCLVAKKLDDIAKERRHNRPYSCELTIINPPNDKWTTEQLVLKREQSVCAEDAVAHLTEERRTELLSNRYSWLVQEYMPLLKQVGEWKVTVIEGHVQHIVFTHMDKQHDMIIFAPTNEIKPMRNMWKLLEQGKSHDEIALGEKGASDDARRVLVDFVEWHVNRLATLEERYYGEKSSLRTLCRIDVGLMRVKKTQLHWFVNEVQRGPNTTLFGRAGEELFISLANRFSDAFWGWYQDRHRTIY